MHSLIFIISILAQLLVNYTWAQQLFELTINGQVRRFTNKVDIPATIPYELFWDKLSSSATVLHMGIRATPRVAGGWVAVGFNERLSMIESIAVIGMIPANTSRPTVLPYHLTARTTPGVQPAPASIIRDSEIEYIKLKDGATKVSFAFNLVLSQVPAVQKKADVQTGILFAHGIQPRSVTQVPGHIGLGSSTRLALDGSQNTVKRNDRRFYLVLFHAIFMIVMWLVLVPFAVFAVHPKIRTKFWAFDKTSNPKFTLVHRALLGFGSILALIAFIIGFFFIGSRTVIAHFTLGVIILIGLVVQVFLGFWRTRIFPTNENENKLHRWGKSWKSQIVLVHSWLGRLCWALAVANIFIGYDVFPLTDKILLSILIVLAVLGFSLLIAGPLYSRFAH